MNNVKAKMDGEVRKEENASSQKIGGVCFGRNSKETLKEEIESNKEPRSPRNLG